MTAEINEEERNVVKGNESTFGLKGIDVFLIEGPRVFEN